jgi:hypothetical protein
MTKRFLLFSGTRSIASITVLTVPLPSAATVKSAFCAKDGASPKMKIEQIKQKTFIIFSDINLVRILKGQQHLPLPF